MEKSPDAFRTISEVAELLETPAHVLRFWESRFPQIRPVKRAGGRRYYRPADVALLTGIKRLLHDDGMTIRGVQKILREQGVKHVSGVTEDTGTDDDAALEAALAALGGEARDAPSLPAAEAETAQIIALQTALNPQPDTSAYAKVTDEAEEMAAQDNDEVEGDAIGASTQADKPEDQDAAAPPADSEEEGLTQAGSGLNEPAPEGERVFWQGSAEPVFDPAMGRGENLDLFAHSAMTDQAGTSETIPAPQEPEQDTEDEAPMSVWAEPEEPDARPEANVTRFADARADSPSALGSDTIPEQAQEPEQPSEASPAPVQTEETAALVTLATRLRAQTPEALSAADHAKASELRDAARALRQRMASPVRPNL
ncbi:MAG: MerR family transcriptional regulator [Rhodobacteraceae bacterium]|nr:MerR family transcriptional regulator [Paracoccaceae bacterium]MCF8515844.1 MerR family transcriptional regulator [Paracoccaceae bacterium]MCF8520077.1 MerR family transcriptional regulator [Paracoccaceae bacterium]